MARQRKLSRDEVLEAALAQIEEGGLESLSMRGLGERLGVEAMALYRYVGKKEELVVLLRDQLFRSVRVPESTERPRRDLEDLCLAMWRAFTARPGAQALLVGFVDEGRVPDAPSKERSRYVAVASGGHDSGQAWLPIAEAMLRSLKELIPASLDRAYAFHALLSFVLGQSVFGAALPPRAAQGVGLSPQKLEDYPEISQIAEALANRSPEVEFELGLRAMLSAIERRAPF